MEKTKTMVKPRAYIGHLMILTSTLIYSFNTNFMKMLMPRWIEPEALVLLRCAVSVAVFWLACLFLRPGEGMRPCRKDVGMMMLGGVLGMGGNLLLYIRGLSMTGPVDAFVIRTVQPIVVIVFAVIFLHEVFTRNKAVGILLGVAGTLYVSLMPHGGAVKDSLAGDVLVFLSAVCYAFFLILIKPYTQKFNSLVVMKWMSLSALLIALPFGMKQLLHTPAFVDGAPLHVWLELAYTLIFATLIAYVLNLKALKYVTPFVESAYIYLLPVTGAIVAIWLGLQSFSWHDPIALALIVAGFFMINKKKRIMTDNSHAPE